MLQPDTGWLNGYKNRAHIYAVYKRTISDIGHTQGMEKVFHENRNQKKAGVAMLRQNRL